MLIELTEEGYVDRLFTNSDYQRRRVETSYRYVENLDFEQACGVVSKVAGKFFVHMRFVVNNEKKVERKGKR